MIDLRIYEFLKYLKQSNYYAHTIRIFLCACACVCVWGFLSFSWGYDRDGCAFGRRAVLVNSHRSVTNGKDCEAGVWSNLDRNLIMIRVNKPRIITVLRNDKRSIDRFTSGCRKLKKREKNTVHHLSRRFSFWRKSIRIHYIQQHAHFCLEKVVWHTWRTRALDRFCLSQVFFITVRELTTGAYLDYSSDKRKKKKNSFRPNTRSLRS